MNDRGAASMFVPAFIALGLVLLAAAIGVGTLLGAKAQAQAAADAAALAAAPVTFRPFGASGTAADEAARFAAANGALLARCDCSHDATFERRTVTIDVTRDINLPIVGKVSVPAAARAEFAPAELLRP